MTRCDVDHHQSYLKQDADGRKRMECSTSRKMRRARSLAVAITGRSQDTVIMSCELERRLRNIQSESDGRIEVQVTAISGKRKPGDVDGRLQSKRRNI
jgi:hypothetical protein